jgi:energy-coupling factor transporter transmembrane protein EcfT
MNMHSIGLAEARAKPRYFLGTFGHMAIFVWFLGMVMLVSQTKVLTTTVLCLIVAFVVYPFSFRSLLRLRWLAFMLLLAVPTVFLLGEIDSEFLGIAYSSEGLLAGIQISARFVVVLIAVDAFTSTVDIPTLAGILERFGMQGLGFSIGVALNLLPGLQQSCIQTWQSMRMRGGLRRNRLHGLKLMAVTIFSNAIRQAEDVALAAEARAFSPEKSRPLPIRKGQFDWLPITLGATSIIVMFLI